MAENWPSQYTTQQAAVFLQDQLPGLLTEISAMRQKIAMLEAQVVTLEQTKADRKGRKPKTVGADALVGES